jgi:hypothetical protein
VTSSLRQATAASAFCGALKSSRLRAWRPHTSLGQNILHASSHAHQQSRTVSTLPQAWSGASCKSPRPVIIDASRSATLK